MHVLGLPLMKQRAEVYRRREWTAADPTCVSPRIMNGDLPLHSHHPDMQKTGRAVAYKTVTSLEALQAPQGK